MCPILHVGDEVGKAHKRETRDMLDQITGCAPERPGISVIGVKS